MNYLLIHLLLSDLIGPFKQSWYKKGESLEDFDHVLDMVGHGWAWLQDHTSIEQC